MITDSGEIVVPIDLRAFGHWLWLLFGDPTDTTAAGVHTHEFHSGATALPSMALEVGMLDVPRFFMHAGVRANTLAFRMQRSGAANATVGLIAQGETAAGTSSAGAPAELALTRFNQFQAEIRRDGTALANVVAGEASYSNNLDPIEVLRSDGRIGGADPTVAALTGSIEVRFADTALLDTATNGEAIELVCSYRIDDDRLFRLTAHEVHLPKPKLALSGPGGVQASFSWQAARSAAVGRMATAVLVNDVESYIA